MKVSNNLRQKDMNAIIRKATTCVVADSSSVIIRLTDITQHQIMIRRTILLYRTYGIAVARR